MPPRRFPAPWKAVELKESYRVEDASGFAIAYVYFDVLDNFSSLSPRPTKDEARRIAVNIAKLPELLGK